jgi:uncharacterized protein YfdQ (DUF2303 family)
MSDTTLGPRTENDALIEALEGAHVPDELEDGGIYGYKLRDGVRLIDLDTDEYAARRPRPRRKKGTIVVRDVASFAQYHAKHADGDTEIWADLDHGTITAVLNAHQTSGDAPRWEDHRLVLKLTPTEPWKRWTANDRRMLPQLAFAEFLEDNLPDIASDPVPAAQMLEIATTFQAKTRVSYSSGTVLASGAISLKYEETTDASGGAKGDMVVPKVFAVGLAPFDDVEPYRIEARLRHRIESSSLKLCYILDRPEDVVRDAVKTVVAKVEEQIEASIMRGEPARA